MTYKNAAIQPQKNNQYGIPVPGKITPFSEVLPMDKIFNRGMIDSISRSIISPEVDRQKFRSQMNQDRSFGQTGAFRTGVGQRMKGDLSDAFERQREEQTMAFAQPVQNMLTDFYNQMSTNYYQNPSFTAQTNVPSFGSFANRFNNLLN